MSAARPFRILGIQQIAIGGEDKQRLRRLWVDMLGLSVDGHFVSGIEGEVILDLFHACFGGLVRPSRIFQSRALGDNGIIACDTFVRAGGALCAGVKEGGGDVFARKIDHEGHVAFAQFQCIAAFAQDGPSGTHNPCALCFADFDIFRHDASP